MATATASTTTIVITVGIDLGCENCKVVLGGSTVGNSSCEIVRSDAGNHITPTTVAFDNKVRLSGEEALSVQKGGNKNSIIHLNRLLQLQSSQSSKTNNNDNDSVDLLQAFYQFDYVTIQEEEQDDTTTTSQAAAAAEEVIVTVDYNGKLQAFSASALLAQFLGKIKASVQATIHRLTATTAGGGNTTVTNGNNGHNNNCCYKYRYVFAVHPSTTLFACQQIVHAAFAAGLVSSSGDDDNDDNDDNNVLCVPSSAAYCQTYQRKFPPTTTTTSTTDTDDATERRRRQVLIIDMGHAQTTVTVLEESSSVSSLEQQNGGFKVLVSKSDENLGAGCIDVRLWRYFTSTNKSLLSTKQIQPKSRAGYRLLEACRNLKHLLSQLPDANVMVENISEDTDVQLSMSRAQLAELCQPEVHKLQQLIQTTLKEALASNCEEICNITAVEVLGGGCRIPFVQSAILASLPPNNSHNNDDMTTTTTMTLSRSLDDTSAALGAALVGEQQQLNNTQDGIALPIANADTESSIARRRQQKHKLRQAELTMQALDGEQKAIAGIRNQVESRVLELRSARHSNKHGSLLPDQPLTEYLNELDDWLFSEEANENATLDTMQTKWQETQAKLLEMCTEYNSAVEKDKATKEKEMDDAAKQAAAEMDNGNEDNNDDNDDHDNRRLPKKRRMEIVMKNKEEANELFKDGNFKFAAARYTKALTHCAKFVDLNPDDEKEVKAIKVTLNLNLALAYCKMDNCDQALRVCNDALSLDNVNVKALYRRSAVYFEQKKWDDAKKDIQKAMQLAAAAAAAAAESTTTEDKAFQKLADRIDAQLKKEKEKEKKMAAKMFG